MNASYMGCRHHQIIFGHGKSKAEGHKTSQPEHTLCPQPEDHSNNNMFKEVSLMHTTLHQE